VSIHPDEEFNLRAALERELRDVVPDDQLAATIIARHRTVRRRRLAGALGLVIVFAGIGVPLGLVRAAGGASRPGDVVLRLDPYTLRLPGQYHPAAVSSAPCGPQQGGSHPGPAAPAGSPAADPMATAAAVASGACLVMLLTSPFIPGTHGDPNVSRGARPVTLGQYDAWLIPRGYWRSGGTTLVIEKAEPGGRLQDLVITSAGLSQSAMLSLVSAGLS
jgi:hypothetical protein